MAQSLKTPLSRPEFTAAERLFRERATTSLLPPQLCRPHHSLRRRLSPPSSVWPLFFPATPIALPACSATSRDPQSSRPALLLSLCEPDPGPELPACHHGARVQHVPELAAHLRLPELQDAPVEPRRHYQQSMVVCSLSLPTLTTPPRTFAASTARLISSTRSSTSPRASPASAT